MLLDFDDSSNDTDLYYVEVSIVDPDQNGSAFMLQTASSSPVAIHDLQPATPYYFRLRTHDASAPSIVWHWRSPEEGDTIQCTTNTSDVGGVYALTRRAGSQAGFDFVEVQWNITDDALKSVVQNNIAFEACFSRVGSHDVPLGRRTVQVAESCDTSSGDLWRQFSIDTVTESDDSDRKVKVLWRRFSGMVPGSTYVVTIKAGSMRSDPYVIRTLPQGRNFTELFRISEYTVDFDFLANHDSASLEASSAFLTNTNDDNFFNLNVSSPPVTKYCVEHVLQSEAGTGPSPQIVDSVLPSDAFAEYISCNGPEAEPRTHPEDPVCICEAYADRLIGLEPASVIDAACGIPSVDPRTGQHDAPDCNCSGSKWNLPPNSDRYIGASTVWEPYFYYQFQRESYPGAKVAGLWYSTPAGGACSETQSVGDGNCTWKRHAVATAIYGAQLMEHGWNNSVRRFDCSVLIVLKPRHVFRFTYLCVDVDGCMCML